MVVDIIKTENMDQRKSETRNMKVPYQIDKAKIRGANYNGSIQRLLTGMVKKIPRSRSGVTCHSEKYGLFMSPKVLPERVNFCYHAATMIGEFLYPEFA